MAIIPQMAAITTTTSMAHKQVCVQANFVTLMLNALPDNAALIQTDVVLLLAQPGYAQEANVPPITNVILDIVISQGLVHAAQDKEVTTYVLEPNAISMHSVLQLFVRILDAN